MPDIAYSARFYAQGRKQSYSHIYLSHGDGTGRRQLTSGNSSHYGVAWLDADHLAWAEFPGVVPIGSDGTKIYTVSLVVFDVKANSKKTIYTIKSNGPEAEVDPAKAEYYFYDGVEGKSHYRSFRITKKGVIEGTAESDTPRFGTSDMEVSTKIHGNVSTAAGSFDFDYEIKYDESTTLDLTITKVDLAKRFKLPSAFIKSVRPMTGSKFLVISAPNFNKSDIGEYLSVVDFETGSVKTVVPKIANLTLHSDDAFWAGNQAEYTPLAPLKDGRQVWTNYLYTGDWKSGKRWTIASGLVYVSSFHLRPR